MEWVGLVYASIFFLLVNSSFFFRPRKVVGGAVAVRAGEGGLDEG